MTTTVKNTIERRIVAMLLRRSARARRKLVRAVVQQDGDEHVRIYALVYSEASTAAELARRILRGIPL